MMQRTQKSEISTTQSEEMASNIGRKRGNARHQPVVEQVVVVDGKKVGS